MAQNDDRRGSEDNREALEHVRNVQENTDALAEQNQRNVEENLEALEAQARRVDATAPPDTRHPAHGAAGRLTTADDGGGRRRMAGRRRRGADPGGSAPRSRLAPRLHWP